MTTERDNIKMEILDWEINWGVVLNAQACENLVQLIESAREDARIISLVENNQATDPVAYLVRDGDDGYRRDFSDYYSADQFYIENSHKMNNPQFLFCYDSPKKETK